MVPSLGVTPHPSGIVEAQPEGHIGQARVEQGVTNAPLYD